MAAKPTPHQPPLGASLPCASQLWEVPHCRVPATSGWCLTAVCEPPLGGASLLFASRHASPTQVRWVCCWEYGCGMSPPAAVAPSASRTCLGG
eukprot:1159398-Pelagomonas_calceolata.AAC.23